MFPLYDGINSVVKKFYLIFNLQLNLMPQPAKKKYISDSDELILEDELQRIVLVGNIDIQKSITGKRSTVNRGE